MFFSFLFFFFMLITCSCTNYVFVLSFSSRYTSVATTTFHFYLSPVLKLYLGWFLSLLAWFNAFNFFCESTLPDELFYQFRFSFFYISFHLARDNSIYQNDNCTNIFLSPVEFRLNSFFCYNVLIWNWMDSMPISKPLRNAINFMLHTP